MANRIREFRERAGLTQAELAKLVDTDEASLSRWENSARPLTPRVIEQFARIFKISSWELFFDRDALRRLGDRTGGRVDGDVRSEDADE